MSYVFSFMNSPVGKLKLVASPKGLAAILWENDNPDRVRLGEMHEHDSNPIIEQAKTELKEYFAGKRHEFSLALDFEGTEFQRKVWSALLTIPFGTTRTYTQIAEQIGKPKAIRAVGAANGKNPISIVAPCHRVIGTSGSLTGFAGGLAHKAYLLQLEGGDQARQQQIEFSQSDR